MANIWADALPDERRSPKSDHRMALQILRFPWRWIGDTISLDLGFIWQMPAYMHETPGSREDLKRFRVLLAKRNSGPYSVRMNQEKEGWALMLSTNRGANMNRAERRRQRIQSRIRILYDQEALSLGNKC